MSRSVANVAIATDTFAGWLGKTNVLLDSLSNEIVTVSNTSGGSNTSGNGSVLGTLTATTIGALTIKGGGVGNTANITTLTIGIANSTTSSNVVVTGYTANVSANNLNITSNTNIGSGTQTIYFNTSNVTVNTAVLNISSTSNLVVNTSLTVTGEATVNNSLTFDSKAAVVTKTSTLAFPNTSTQNTVDSFSFTDFKGAKYTINVTDNNNSNNRALTELSVVYGFSNTHMTEFGTIYSNTQFATFTVSSNSTHVILNANSATSNATFKVYRISFI